MLFAILRLALMKMQIRKMLTKYKSTGKVSSRITIFNYAAFNFQVCEDEAGNFCTKNKKKCNKADVQERCPVTCDLCPEELTTTQEPINPTTEVTGSSPTSSSGTTTQEPNNPKPEVNEFVKF